MTTAYWEIITPDGAHYNLTGRGLGVRVADGTGFPPLEHVTRTLPLQHGGKLDSIWSQPRTVTITEAIGGDCLWGLQDLLQILVQAVRFDRTCSVEPLTLRYHLDGVDRDLYCHLGGFVEDKNDLGDTYITGIRLVAYDPFFYDPDEMETWARSVQAFTVRNIVRKSGGAWDGMGPPNVAGTYGGVFAIAEDADYIYIGGNFDNWDNIANADNIVRYDKSTGTYSALNATPLNSDVYALAVAPNGIVYIGGGFTNAGGDANADFLCQYNPSTGAFSSLNATPFGNTVWALKIAAGGIMYVGGDFTNAGGDANADYVCQCNLATGAYSSLCATPLDGGVYALALGGSNLYLGGDFLGAGGDADADFVCKFDMVAFSALTDTSLNGQVRALMVDKSGRLYIGGDFANAGGYAAADYICRWNGVEFQAMGSEPPDGRVRVITILDDGLLIAGGDFTTIGGIDIADRMASWNGYTWAQLDIDLPGVPGIYAVHESGDNDLYIGFDTTGYTIASVTNTVAYDGSAETYPLVEFSGTGMLQNMENEHTGDQLWADMLIDRGETITFDFTPNVKTAESDWRGDVLPDIYPASDFATFSLVPNPIATDGNNSVSVFIADQPAVYLDDQGPAGDAQLDLLENVTGLTDENTDVGRLYISIIDDGGGFFHVNFYDDAARGAGDLVAHTASYNAAGAQALVADNASGVGGAIYIVSATAADANIYADYALVKFRYHNRYWTLADALAD